jgi:hypothetical protein
MLDKLKAFAETAKGWLLYVLTPLAFIAGFIYYLITSKEALQHKLDESNAEKNIDESKIQEGEIDEKANEATDSYDAIRKQYLKDNPSGSDQS